MPARADAAGDVDGLLALRPDERPRRRAAGVLPAGYSTKACQGMGDAFVLPAITAVVIGGTKVPGGSGRYADAIAVVVLSVLPDSVLSIMVTA